MSKIVEDAAIAYVAETIGNSVDEFTVGEKLLMQTAFIAGSKMTKKDAEMKSEFQKDLELLLNRHSMENGSNTPDWLLAIYLCNCLKNYQDTVYSRQTWFVNSQPWPIASSDDTTEEK